MKEDESRRTERALASEEGRPKADLSEAEGRREGGRKPTYRASASERGNEAEGRHWMPNADFESEYRLKGDRRPIHQAILRSS